MIVWFFRFQLWMSGLEMGTGVEMWGCGGVAPFAIDTAI